jgi:hypothetical protein
MIFALHQSLVKAHQRRSLGCHGHFTQALRRDQKRAESQQQPIPRGQMGGASLRTLHNEQLILDGERFSDHRANTAATGKPREGHQQVAEQCEQRPDHSKRNSNRLSNVGKSAPRSPTLPKSAFRHTQVEKLFDWFPETFSNAPTTGADVADSEFD